MSNRTVTATIPRAGLSTGAAKAKFEASGFQGEGCRTATELFTNALGVTADEELKAEFYEQVPDVRVQAGASGT